MTETWRDIPGYEGLYQVSDQGRVRSMDRVVPHKIYGEQPIKGRLMKTNPDTGGYPMVFLHRNGRRKDKRVHHLVAEAFVGPRPEGLDVCHNNGIRNDNRAENLRYGTRSENILDAVTHGTHNLSSRTHCKTGHPLGGDNSDGKDRECLACRRAKATVKYHVDLRPHFKEVADIHYLNLVVENKRMLRSDFPF